MFYYRHHIGDFMRDTARLTDAQTMAYLRLLWIYYDTEKPLPNTPEKLAFQVGADPQNVRLILEHFFVLQDDAWRQTRCDKEIAQFHQKAESAKNSANARWKNANAMRTHSERTANGPKSDANQEPITNNQERTYRGESDTEANAQRTLNKRSTNARATRLQADACLTPEMHEFCKTERPDLNPDMVWANFRDFWIAKPGKDGTKLDWLATWRTWVRREAKQKAVQESFYERDQRLKREEWEKITGRKHPDNRTVIDIEEDARLDEIFGPRLLK